MKHLGDVKGGVNLDDGGFCDLLLISFNDPLMERVGSQGCIGLRHHWRSTLLPALVFVKSGDDDRPTISALAMIAFGIPTFPHCEL